MVFFGLGVAGEDQPAIIGRRKMGIEHLDCGELFEHGARGQPGLRPARKVIGLVFSGRKRRKPSSSSFSSRQNPQISRSIYTSIAPEAQCRPVSPLSTPSSSFQHRRAPSASGRWLQSPFAFLPAEPKGVEWHLQTPRSSSNHEPADQAAHAMSDLAPSCGASDTSQKMDLKLGVRPETPAAWHRRSARWRRINPSRNLHRR